MIASVTGRRRSLSDHMRAIKVTWKHQNDSFQKINPLILRRYCFLKQIKRGHIFERHIPPQLDLPEWATRWYLLLKSNNIDPITKKEYIIR